MDKTRKEPRPEKVAVVDEVRARLTAACAAILTEYRGLPVSQMEALRRTLASVGGEYKVYKNTLVRRAANECGLGVLEPYLEGPTGIAFVKDDAAAVAKALRDFARSNPSFVVKGGLLGGDLLDATKAAALADLPSREVLLAQIAGVLAAPMQRFASLLQAVPQKMAYLLAALVDKGGAAGAAPSGELADQQASSVTAAEAEPEDGDGGIAS
jgi:large subunit ribosomal protein L10